ncbi:MAG: ubiquinol-cytochrome c reductase iron-sulfur subunit [Betaproteobacteria bacterium]|nr:ubiquinol-cytochrome c reductase iron-sulfur subunit [Betaproteobacteria bacterium]
MNTGQHLHEIPDPRRRKLLRQATAATGGLALAAASYPFVVSLLPSERARAQGAPVEVDISASMPGALATVEWRGKPVWLLRRTPEMLASLEAERGELTDPDSKVGSQQPQYARNPGRSIRPELFVAVSLCTHLGCIPSYRPEPDSVQRDWPGGFYCPCHGSKFDFAGRVYKGSPAPTNLVVPPHEFLSPDRLIIGRDKEGDAQ